MSLTRNGTEGRTYGGDKNLVHIEDGKRCLAGAKIADFADNSIRKAAWSRGVANAYSAPLCPGCYMVAIFNAAVELAKRSGQPLEELGASLSHAFRKLAENPEAGVTEEIKVLLDPDDDPAIGWQPRGAYANRGVINGFG
jgi:hypothetical protein